MKCYGLNCLFVPAAASECFEKSDPVKNATGSPPVPDPQHWSSRRLLCLYPWPIATVGPAVRLRP